MSARDTSLTCLLVVVCALLVAGQPIRGMRDEHEDHDHGEEGQQFGSFLFDKDPTLSLPMVVTVGLIGFPEYSTNGGPTVDAKELRRMLQSLHHTRRPVDLETEKELHSLTYHITYKVAHFEDKWLEELEERMGSALATAILDQAWQLGEGETLPYPILHIHKHIYSVLDRACADELAQVQAEHFSALFLNPDFEKVKQHARECDRAELLKERGLLHHLDTVLGYTWVYMTDDVAPSHSWVRDGGVAVDMQAERSHIGPPASAVNLSPAQIPRLSEFHGSSVLLAASMANVVASAVRHVFIPDINYVQHTEPIDKVLIPVLVFKDHDDPFGMDPEYLEMQARQLFPTGTSAGVMYGEHSLHDHQHISIAVSKAMRSLTSHQINEYGRFEVVARPYLDSKDLLAELRHSGDALARGLIGDADEGLESFFQADILPKGLGVTRASGTRVIPIYVFSLHTPMDDLTLENFSFVEAAHDCVILLETNNTRVEVPEFYNNLPIEVDGTKEFSRGMFAGLAMTQGVVPPTSSYSQAAGEVIHDYTWATGCHPFGHFTSSRICQMQFSIGRRNFVLARMHKAVSVIHDAVAEVDAFAERYMHGALLNERDVDLPWLDVLYHRGAQIEEPLMYTGTVDRLHDNLLEMQGHFVAISEFLRQHEYDDACKRANAFVFAALAFEKYAHDELEAAELKLRCCTIHLQLTWWQHTPTADIALYSMVSIILVLVFMLVLLLSVAGYAIGRAMMGKPIQNKPVARQVGMRRRRPQ